LRPWVKPKPKPKPDPNQVRGRIGTEWGLRTGPLHSTQVGRCELQGKRPTMEDTLAIEHITAPQIAWPASTSLLFLG